jgi:putative hemolysin
MRMSASKRNSDRMIASLMANPQQILVSILLGNLLVNSLISSLTTQMLLGAFGEYGHLVAIVLVTPVIIVFGEIIPKIISISGCENFARRIILPMNFWHRLAGPVRMVFVSGLNSLIRLFGIELEQKEDISEEELELAVRLSVDRGSLKADESEFINNVLRFSRKTAESVMVPRKEAVALPWGSSVANAVSLFLEADIVRAPEYRGNMDHIVGLVDSRELVACVAGMKRSTTINRFIHPIQFYPATIELSQLLDDFLKRKIQMRSF